MIGPPGATGASEMVRLVIALSAEEIEAAKRLFVEYADSLGFELDFQNFERELAELPGHYAPPTGRLRLALSGDEAVGCIALRRLEEGICELKRLYVRPEHRGRGIGLMLARAGLADAREMGYRAVRLDTVPAMTAATALYRSLGFREIAPYRFNPIAGALFLELRFT